MAYQIPQSNLANADASNIDAEQWRERLETPKLDGEGKIAAEYLPDSPEEIDGGYYSAP